MVENSLGRLWVDGHPNTSLKEECKYYLDEAKQDDSVQVHLDSIFKASEGLKPEDIRCIETNRLIVIQECDWQTPSKVA